MSVKFPLSKFITVTGVSGSGKSTLINETLYGATNNRIYEKIIKTLPYEDIKGIENIDKVINIDQSPIGRTPRSNPATYVGLFTPIREWFANLPEAKVKGFKPGRFSFNVKGGRCESCEGDGLKKIEMHFLAPVYVKCEVCLAYNSIIEKDTKTRLEFLKCIKCGASRTVPPIGKTF